MNRIARALLEERKAKRKQYKKEWRLRNWDKVKEHWRKAMEKKKTVVTIYLPEQTNGQIVFRVFQRIKGKRSIRKIQSEGKVF